MRRIVFYIVLVFIPLLGYSNNKSDRLKPTWLTKSITQSTNDAYFFVTAHGQGSSLESARLDAIKHLSMRLEDEHQYTFDVHVVSKTERHVEHKQNIVQEVTGSKHSSTRQEMTSKGKELDVTFKIIDEYWVYGNGTYDLDILFAVTNPYSYYPGIHDQISTTTKYGAAGLASIIPGTGQFLKGDVAKGVSFLVADVACAAGIILCESTRAAYAAKVQQQPQYALQYSTRANNWATGRNICLGVTAGIWVWNIIDAFAAKGARRVIVKPQGGYFSMTPTSTYDPIHHTHDMGVGVAYHF
jgi:hypothetical protein